MLKFSALLGVVALALTIWCLVEAISANESRVRWLRKPLWILLILVVRFPPRDLPGLLRRWRRR